MTDWNKKYYEIRKFFGNLGISWKFTIAYLLIFALPVIFIGIYINFMSTKSTVEQAELLVKQSLIQNRELINQKIQSIEKTSVSITQNPKILEYLDRNFQNNISGFENYVYFFAPLFDSFIIQNRYVHHTKFYVKNTSFPDAWNGIYHLRRINFDPRYHVFLENEKKLHQWNPVHDSAIKNKITTALAVRVISLSRKLISFESGRNIGVLDIEIAIKTLFENLEADMGVVEYFMVIDETGSIIFENSKTTLPKQKKMELLSAINHEEFSNGIAKLDNNQFIVKNLPIEDIGSHLIGITPLSKFAVNNRNYKMFLTLVIFTTLLVFASLFYFVSNQLTRRLKTLVIGLKSVKYENINMKMTVDYKDEVGELTESFNQMTDRIHILIESVYKAQLLENKYALKALESQINPHFLYNTLSTISWMARKIKADNIDSLVIVLSNFYRLVLSKGASVITVGDEIALLKAYVEIEKTRYGDLFNVVYDLDEDAFRFNMIKIILQPIAENSIHHGFAVKETKGTLVVRLRQDDKSIFFSIIDDGVGISRTKLRDIKQNEILKSDSGYAIQNVRERIKAVYGNEGCLSIFSRLGCGCTVNIIIPKVATFRNF